ncbi:psbP domain-containing protein 5, chloroplastic [Phragmites australis]|uniref:psbP domain-containing protein 5, chloroplastic n=1 Tax=Phragmites australis TaxID=29695 RepID=UPI002D77DC2F|nr:psbP domain-containing protein 5, chloroplastic [Phragmites australis]
MATALSLPTTPSPSSLHPRSRGVVGAGGCVPPARRRRRARVFASCSREPASRDRGLEMERRRLLLSGLASSFAVVLPISESYAVTETNEDVKMNMQVDEINAYSFLYPVELPEKKFSFKWVESRKPERYSSAAPLSPDARQRIVSERVDMIHNVVISVSIGPPNSRFLPSKDKSMWDPKDVADCILSDRSTMKVTTGQRMTESSVLDAHSTEVEGEPYWYYEYLVRKSPTKSAPEPNLFRHNVACTAERDGYLYSLNASALSKQWESVGPFLQKTVASFRLLPPTENYVPPYKDPWRFW